MNGSNPKRLDPRLSPAKFRERLKAMDPALWREIDAALPLLKRNLKKKFSRLDASVIDDAVATAEERLVAGLRRGVDYNFGGLEEVVSFLVVSSRNAIIDHIRASEGEGHHIPAELSSDPDFIKKEYFEMLRSPDPEKRLEDIGRAVCAGWYDSVFAACDARDGSEMMEKSRDRFMARFKEATRLAREQKNRRAAGQPAFSGDWPGEDERGAGVAAGYSRIEIEAVARAVAAFVAALSPEQRDFFFECMLGETRIADYRGWKGQFELYEEKRSLLGGLVKCFRKNGINPETVGRESILAAFSKISADQSAKDPIPAVLKGEG